MELREATAWRRGTYVSLSVFLAALLYATIRYHVVRDVALTHLPLFTTNKAVALASVLLIGLSFLLGSLARFWPETFAPHVSLRKPLGLIGFGAAGLHSVMSLALLSPENYPRFFEAAGRFSLVGETAILAGVLSLFIFSIVAAASIPSVAGRLSPSSWKRIQRMGYLALAFTLAHVAIPGMRGWLDGGSYAYGLISISLIAALSIILVFLLRLLSTGPGART